MSAATDRFKQQMSAGWPHGPRDTSQTYVVTSTSSAPPARKTRLIGGLWMVDDGDGWRFATPAEIEGLA